MFESLPDFRKIVLLFFLNKNDLDILKGCGFLKSDNIRLPLEFKIFYWNKMKSF